MTIFDLEFEHKNILVYAIMIIAIIQGIILYANANRKKDNELKKIWNDTLKNPSGKYSRKSLYMFICFYVGVFMGICLVITDVDQFGEFVFTTYFMTGTGLNLLAHFDKRNSANQKINEEQT